MEDGQISIKILNKRTEYNFVYLNGYPYLKKKIYDDKFSPNFPLVQITGIPFFLDFVSFIAHFSCAFGDN